MCYALGFPLRYSRRSLPSIQILLSTSGPVFHFGYSSFWQEEPLRPTAVDSRFGHGPLLRPLPIWVADRWINRLYPFATENIGYRHGKESSEQKLLAQPKQTNCDEFPLIWLAYASHSTFHSNPFLQGFAFRSYVLFMQVVVKLQICWIDIFNHPLRNLNNRTYQNSVLPLIITNLIRYP